MHCKGYLKLKSQNTSYSLIEVVTKTGWTIYIYIYIGLTLEGNWGEEVVTL